MKTALPTYADFGTFCGEIGVNVPTEAFYDNLLEEVVDEWNDATGYVFFNLTEASGTRTYNFPVNYEGVLILSEYWSTITGLTVNGMSTTDYELRNGRTLRFNNISHGDQVVLTGVIGVDSFSTSVYNRLNDYMVYKYIVANPSRQFKSVEQMDVTLVMGPMRDAPYEFERLAQTYRW